MRPLPIDMPYMSCHMKFLPFLPSRAYSRENRDQNLEFQPVMLLTYRNPSPTLRKPLNSEIHQNKHYQNGYGSRPCTPYIKIFLSYVINASYWKYILLSKPEFI